MDLALQMNLLSTSSLDDRPALNLSRKQLNMWLIYKKREVSITFREMFGHTTVLRET